MGAARIGCLGAGLAPAFSRGSSTNITNTSTASTAHKPLLWALAALGVALVALESLQPLAFDAPSLRAVIETATTLCATVGAGLFGLSFVHHRRLRDLLLMGVLVAMAVVDVASCVVPATTDPTTLASLTAGPMAAELLMALALLAAAMPAADRKIGPTRRPLLIATGLGILAAASAELGGLLLHSALGVQGHLARDAFASGLHHPVGAVLTFTVSALLVGEAAYMPRRSNRFDIATMLAAASMLLAVGRIDSLVVPTQGIEWVTASQILRLAAFAVILAAAIKQDAALRRFIAHTAAADERQRIARDLHDGLAQDLAFIAAHGERIAREAGEDHPLAIAARRALAVSRGAIADLSASDAPTATSALRRVADELELRFGVQIQVVADDAALMPQAREDVVRITREAIVNAVKGDARNIVVTLVRSADHVSLRIVDDGRGIGTAELKPHVGFGLRSMAERAAALGGGLTTRQPVNGGTELEVVFR